MLSRLKKKSEVTAPVVPAWHPDLRNFERLPDIKVVRTAFFTNGISVVIALVAVFIFGYREYQLYDLERQIADWQRQIDRDRSVSTAAVGQFKRFQAEAARIAEVELVNIDESTTSDSIRKELQWSAAYYRLAGKL